MLALDFAVLASFKETYGRHQPVAIDFLGLWDTVSTFGWIYSPIFLPYTTNNPGVQIVRHALAIDERRVFFRPLYWGNRFFACDQKEVWFAGVHSGCGWRAPRAHSQSGQNSVSVDADRSPSARPGD